MRALIQDIPRLLEHRIALILHDQLGDLAGHGGEAGVLEDWRHPFRRSNLERGWRVELRRSPAWKARCAPLRSYPRMNSIGSGCRPSFAGSSTRSPDFSNSSTRRRPIAAEALARRRSMARETSSGFVKHRKDSTLPGAVDAGRRFPAGRGISAHAALRHESANSRKLTRIAILRRNAAPIL